MKVVLKEVRKVVDWAAMSAELIEKVSQETRKGKRDSMFFCRCECVYVIKQKLQTIIMVQRALFVVRQRVETTTKGGVRERGYKQTCSLG